MLDSSLCYLGRYPWVDYALLGLSALPMSLDSSERHSYWPETQLCLPEMLLDQHISSHGCLVSSCFVL